MSESHDPRSAPPGADARLTSLLDAWRVFDERLSPMHRAYHEELRHLTSVSRKSAPHTSLAQTSTIPKTAQYSTISTERIISRGGALPPHHSSASQGDDMSALESSQGTLSPNRSYPADLSSSRSASNIWSRDGFTPAPQIPSLPSPESVSSPEPPRAFASPSLKTNVQALNQNFDEVLVGGSESSDEPLLEASASAEELEAFSSIAERLMRAQERMESERASDDSSRPAPLDDLYEPSPLPRSTRSIISRSADHFYDDDLLGGGVAPEPLRARSQRSWGKTLLVILIVLGVSSIVIYTKLKQLW